VLQHLEPMSQGGEALGRVARCCGAVGTSHFVYRHGEGAAELVKRAHKQGNWGACVNGGHAASNSVGVTRGLSRLSLTSSTDAHRRGGT
jgi:hypothetical protein